MTTSRSVQYVCLICDAKQSDPPDETWFCNGRLQHKVPSYKPDGSHGRVEMVENVILGDIKKGAEQIRRFNES